MRGATAWGRWALLGTSALTMVGCTTTPARRGPPPPPTPIAPAHRAAALPPAPAAPKPGFTGCFEPRMGPKRMSLSDGLMIDLDRDGAMDLVALGARTGIKYEESLFILGADHQGGFAIRSHQRVPAGWLGLVIADFDGDGHLDLAADDYERGTVDVRMGQSSGGYGESRVHPIGQKAGQLASADFDGDGRLDLAVPMVDEVKILKGTGTGSFIGLQTLRTGKYPTRPAVVDLDRDGKLDVAVASNDSHQLHVFLHRDGRLQAAADYRCGTGGAHLAVGDFDGDGNDDIAVGNINSHTTCVFGGNGKGGLALREEIVDGGWGAAAADLDHDGHAELIVSSAVRRGGHRAGPWGALSVYRHEGGKMQLQAKLDTLAPAEQFWFRDVDGDRKTDLITISQKGVMTLLSRPCPG